MSKQPETQDDLERFRTQALAWLEENFPKSLTGKGAAIAVDEGSSPSSADASLWRKRLGEQGWGTPTWPRELGGGGLTQAQARVLQAEMRRLGAFNIIQLVTGLGVTMVGPTLLEYGTEDQKRRHIPPICRGDYRWCLGYSEPNAGSDLASLSTRAEDAGDHWVVNGQKLWTSGANHSDWCGALVRTDPKVKKHHGISFLLINMHQPSVQTRPIKLIAGVSPFCETFFDNARAEKNDLLGNLNDGWNVGKRLLQHERASQTGAIDLTGSDVHGESLPDIAKRYIGTDAQGYLADPDLRMRLAKHLMEAQAHALTLQRVAAESRGKPQVSDVASILKNAATTVAQTRAELMLEIMGYRALGWEGDGFGAHELAAVRNWLAGKAMSIYGGSFEIQNNIISKTILGLPETTQRVEPDTSAHRSS
jgi:alkylation response protein AidB-like acyl-CoA dehydrogenase